MFFFRSVLPLWLFQICLLAVTGCLSQHTCAQAGFPNSSQIRQLPSCYSCDLFSEVAGKGPVLHSCPLSKNCHHYTEITLHVLPLVCMSVTFFLKIQWTCKTKQLIIHRQDSPGMLMQNTAPACSAHHLTKVCSLKTVVCCPQRSYIQPNCATISVVQWNPSAPILC